MGSYSFAVVRSIAVPIDQETVIEVEADNEEQAKAKAIELAKEKGHHWETISTTACALENPPEELTKYWLN